MKTLVDRLALLLDRLEIGTALLVDLGLYSAHLGRLGVHVGRDPLEGLGLLILQFPQLSQLPVLGLRYLAPALGQTGRFCLARRELLTEQGMPVGQGLLSPFELHSLRLDGSQLGLNSHQLLSFLMNRPLQVLNVADAALPLSGSFDPHSPALSSRKPSHFPRWADEISCHGDHLVAFLVPKGQFSGFLNRIRDQSVPRGKVKGRDIRGVLRPDHIKQPGCGSIEMRLCFAPEILGNFLQVDGGHDSKSPLRHKIDDFLGAG